MQGGEGPISALVYVIRRGKKNNMDPGGISGKETQEKMESKVN